jgi:hypothetical protein
MTYKRKNKYKKNMQRAAWTIIGNWKTMQEEHATRQRARRKLTNG